MTNNQIQFFKAKEEARHNLVSEELGRGNIDASYYAAGAGYASAAAAMAGVAESRRHNVETEAINWYSAQNQGVLQGAQAKREQATAFKTKAEGYKVFSETDYVKAQTEYAKAQMRESLARQGLISAQTTTEKMRPGLIAAEVKETDSEIYRNYARGTRDYFGIASDLLPILD